MDRKLINPAIVQDIAAAIREKGGSEDPIVVNALGDAIRALPQGMGDNTTEVVEAISGEQPEGDIAIANAIAKGATDAAREHVWQGERATDEGRELRDGVAFVSSLKGRSFKMSQLTDLSSQREEATANGITFTRKNNVIKVSGTATATTFSDIPAALGAARTIRLVVGHKYLPSVPVSNSGNIRLQAYYSIGGAGREYVGSTFIANESDSGNQMNLRIRVASGATANGESFPIALFDLTAMGMEDVVDADDFAHRLGYADAASLPYIPYGEQIVNSKPTEVVSRGRNLWDEEWERGGIDGTTGANTGGYEGVWTRCKNRLPISSTSLFSRAISPECNSAYIYQYDADGNYLGRDYRLNYGPNQSRVLSLTPQTRYFRFAFRLPDFEGVDICFNVSDDMNGTYTPYMRPSTLPLPLSSIMHEGQPLFPQGLCGIGDVKDEVDFKNGKAIKRIGVVDMSAVRWNKSSTEGRFYARLNGAKYTNSAYGLEAISTFFLNNPSVHYNQLNNKEMSVGNYIDGLGFAGIVVMSMEDKDLTKEAFGQKMGGEFLYYQLATPIEVTFDPAKAFYRVQNGGTEEAVMDGVSAPLVADIAYRDNMAYAEEAALLAFANERSGQNDADLGDAIRTLSE